MDICLTIDEEGNLELENKYILFELSSLFGMRVMFSFKGEL